MNELKDAKQKYEEIPIPDVLSASVQEAICWAAEDRELDARLIHLRKRHKFYKRCSIAAATFLAMFTLLLNTNTAFAQGMSGVPVIGGLAKVLTFASYVKTTDATRLAVEVPKLEMVSGNDLQEAVNKEILFYCDLYAAEAQVRAEEYKKVFLETGGTPEEWKEHDLVINIRYEMKSQTENYLSFMLIGTESWNSAGAETRYYNIDLKSEKLLTLQDLLGDDYINIVNESIKKQIPQKEKELGVEFFTDEDGFTGISDTQKFYIAENGNPVIVFDKYEIAVGAAGEVEFEITK